MDTTLTKDTLFDFFLVPQVVRQGNYTGGVTPETLHLCLAGFHAGFFVAGFEAGYLPIYAGFLAGFAAL